ncbi:MAG: DNA alkylation repair protein [candidate division Zixibacteria bacterium]|nr:DNA alkylation repair protein [candidate division Zixibacteria bacterium]MDH3936158.1 DNA alkylation repair protein [candidate division Zixibacteria bacterium]MDH4032990.1 DNA alkylation repair protein [candidate division Zixibacteria bacterium]
MTKAKPKSSPLWKDWVDDDMVNRIAQVFSRAYSKFDKTRFIRELTSRGFFDLNLKDRINRISETLGRFLPNDYPKAVGILLKAAPQLGEFENWALTGYVERFGQGRFGESMRALKALTPYGTGEFAIRSFIIKQPIPMLEVMSGWADDPNEHVRRLAAEGSRPRGVWTAHIEAFKKDPRPVLKLLEKLKADSSLYVRKAVANNLNDISKENPDIVIKWAERWLADNNPHTNWIVKRGCRTLVKNGDPRVFGLLGFTVRPKIDLVRFGLTPKRIEIGSALSLGLHLRSTAAKHQKLAIDYRISYTRPADRTSMKLFKWSEKILPSQDSLKLETVRSFADQNTRRHYPGRHRVELIINGVVWAATDFHVFA